MGNLIRRRERGPASVERRREPSQRDPFQSLASFWQADPLDIVRDMLRSSALGGMERGVSFIPSMELRETDDAFVLKADLPGVSEEDVEIEVIGNRVTIGGTREEEQTEEGETFLAYERSYGTFSRSFTFPEGANVDEIAAELTDGVLTVKVPKRPEVQPRRISVGPKQHARQPEIQKGPEAASAGETGATTASSETVKGAEAGEAGEVGGKKAA